MVSCDNLRQAVAEVNIVNTSLEKRMLKVEKVLESTGSVLFQRDLVNGVQSQVQLTTSADNFMFGADCCDKDSSWDGHGT